MRAAAASAPETIAWAPSGEGLKRRGHQTLLLGLVDTVGTRRRAGALAATDVGEGQRGERVWGVFPEDGVPPKAVLGLAEQVQEDGGSVLALYQEPVGQAWQIFALLPMDQVKPTPYQRDLSATHAAFNYYTTDIVSIHEVYPGHYVQFLC